MGEITSEGQHRSARAQGSGRGTGPGCGPCISGKRGLYAGGNRIVILDPAMQEHPAETQTLSSNPMRLQLSSGIMVVKHPQKVMWIGVPLWLEDPPTGCREDNLVVGVFRDALIAEVKSQFVVVDQEPYAQRFLLRRGKLKCKRKTQLVANARKRESIRNSWSIGRVPRLQSCHEVA